MRKKNNNEYQTLILAALLHDIGKFWQRTEEEKNNICREYLPNIEIYCPFNKEGKYFTHEHVLFSGSFVKRFISMPQIENLVLNHHLPSNKNEKILQIADWVSSGERFEGEEFEEKRYFETPLLSIFSEIELEDAQLDSEKALYFPLSCLGDYAKDKFFPTQRFKLSRNDYQNLWDDFINELEALKKLNYFFDDIPTWYYLLKKYLSRIPSATPTKVGDYTPDISLFDHSRTTAAVADCLFKLELEESELDTIINTFWSPATSEQMKKNRFLFICGDVSGIQKFVYSITSKGASHGLKGRSYYLQLLTQSVAKFILQELNLSIVNLIYSSGGHFYILSHLDKEEDLVCLREKVNEKMLKGHQGDLGLSLGWIPLAMNDFLKGNFSKVWRDVAEKVNEVKRVKFKEVMLKDYDNIFGYLDKGGKIKLCESCKRELKEDEDKDCGFCKSFEELGTNLARKEVLIVERNVTLNEKINNKPINRYEDVLRLFGCEYNFQSIEDLKKITFDDHRILTLINSTDLKSVVEGLSDFYKQKESNQRISICFDFLGQATPLEDKNIKTFEKLAKDSEGINRLGILRMDVDNLGQIFSSGLGQKATLSRMSSLSSSLTLFFEGWLNEFIKTNSMNNIYLIYSGGDDLFLVGAWSSIIDIGYQIQQRFKEYTKKVITKDDSLTLSCGIALIHHKYPLYKSAEITSDLEKEAKDFRIEKNGLSLLGNIIGWEDFGRVERWKDILVESNKIGKGLITRLRHIYELYKLEEQGLKQEVSNIDKVKKLIYYQKWRWRLVYSLKRYARQNRRFEKEIEEIQDAILKHSFIEHLSLPVRWAELLLRKEG